MSFFAEEPTDFGVSAVGSRAMAGVLERAPAPPDRSERAHAGRGAGGERLRSGRLDRAARRAPARSPPTSSYTSSRVPTWSSGACRWAWSRRSRASAATATSGTGGPTTPAPRRWSGGATPWRRRQRVDPAIERHCRRRTARRWWAPWGAMLIWPNATNVVPGASSFCRGAHAVGPRLLESTAPRTSGRRGRSRRRRDLGLEICRSPPSRPCTSRRRSSAWRRSLPVGGRGGAAAGEHGRATTRTRSPGSPRWACCSCRARTAAAIAPRNGVDWKTWRWACAPCSRCSARLDQHRRASAQRPRVRISISTRDEPVAHPA